MQPSLDPSVAVHTHQILCGAEIADTGVQFFEALECVEEEVKVLGEGYIFDITEADGNPLDVDPGRIGGIAEILAELVIEALGIDDAVLPLAPLEELQVALEFHQRVEAQEVLL